MADVTLKTYSLVAGPHQQLAIHTIADLLVREGFVERHFREQYDHAESCEPLLPWIQTQIAIGRLFCLQRSVEWLVDRKLTLEIQGRIGSSVEGIEIGVRRTSLANCPMVNDNTSDVFEQFVLELATAANISLILSGNVGPFADSQLDLVSIQNDFLQLDLNRPHDISLMFCRVDTPNPIGLDGDTRVPTGGRFDILVVR